MRMLQEIQPFHKAEKMLRKGDKRQKSKSSTKQCPNRINKKGPPSALQETPAPSTQTRQ
jgi:hypothetical protein